MLLLPSSSSLTLDYLITTLYFILPAFLCYKSIWVRMFSSPGFHVYCHTNQRKCLFWLSEKGKWESIKGTRINIERQYFFFIFTADKKNKTWHFGLQCNGRKGNVLIKYWNILANKMEPFKVSFGAYILQKSRLPISFYHISPS